MKVTVEAETLALLRQVAEDAQSLLACNCSYDATSGPHCDGSCTHAMATRALARSLLR